MVCTVLVNIVLNYVLNGNNGIGVGYENVKKDLTPRATPVPLSGNSEGEGGVLWVCVV